MINENEADDNLDKAHRISITRLPCRGCTVECVNYATCDGKPWRLNDLSQSEKYKPAEKHHNAPA